MLARRTVLIYQQNCQHKPHNNISYTLLNFFGIKLLLKYRLLWLYQNVYCVAVAGEYPPLPDAKRHVQGLFMLHGAMDPCMAAAHGQL